MLAYDFPLLSMFWVLIWWFFLFSVFFAVIWAFIDNFRRPDHSGWAKAGWALVILIIGYFVARASNRASTAPVAGSSRTTSFPSVETQSASAEGVIQSAFGTS